MDKPTFDIAQAHKFFATDCFNRAWHLIDKPERSADEDREMLMLTLASLWHWMQREDCTPRNLSVAHWQTSRVYVLLNDPQSAMYHAEKSLGYSQSEPSFYQAYAHEALARAAKLAGEPARMNEHLRQACELSNQVADQEERLAFEKDLQEIASE